MRAEVETSIEIDCPRAVVAAFVSDPDSATTWYVNIKSAQGPFPMETTYKWEDNSVGGTRMTRRNTGEPSGFGKMAVPMMAAAMRKANQKDLARLKTILETRS